MIFVFNQTLLNGYLKWWDLKFQRQYNFNLVYKSKRTWLTWRLACGSICP